jgi:hypothetical protein
MVAKAKKARKSDEKVELSNVLHFRIDQNTADRFRDHCKNNLRVPVGIRLRNMVEDELKGAK